MSERIHSKLQVWQKAVELVTKIYELTKGFPAEERFGLTTQLRRAVISIPSNIAEGVARKTTKEYLQFLYMARGSLSEVDTQLELSRNLDYLKNEDFQEILAGLNEISKMLFGLIKSLENKL